jgi:hypothetical protein
MKGARLLIVALAVSSGACGNTGRNRQETAATAGAGSGGSGGSGGVVAAGGAAGCGATTGGSASCAPMPPSSHGVVPMHRLRGAEYVNSVADLVGVEAAAPAPDEGRPFDAVIDDAQPWFAAATTVAHELFAKAELSEPFDCVTAAGADRSCAVSVIAELGLRAFRRPLLDAETAAFEALYDQLLEQEGARGALEQVVRALLVSPQFLFHVELSDSPDVEQPERLDSYALAARLSFALWSTTPDAALLQAASENLSGDAALGVAYDRLSQDRRALALPDGLGEVWLAAAELDGHEVDDNVLPSFDQELRLGMRGEQHELMRQFWLEPVPLRELLTLDVNYVSAPLADLYGFPPGTLGFATVTDDARIGFLGQAGFLTLTSFERRPSATRRGKFVLDRLLCLRLPEPPPGEAGSLGADFPAGKSERQTLERATASPACVACHQPMDSIGLALAHFDAIGAYRATDSQAQPIDARVQLPDQVVPGGASVDGLGELGMTLASTRRFQACVAGQVASYLIHRDVADATDADLIWPLADRIAEQADLTELTRQIVMSDHFRYRRLAPKP